MVVLGGIRRIADVAAVLVPGMCAIYVGGAVFVLLTHLGELPGAIELVLARHSPATLQWAAL